MELQKRIQDLEAQIVKMKAEFADEKDKHMAEQRKTVADFEASIERLKADHQAVSRQQQNEHNEKVN